MPGTAHDPAPMWNRCTAVPNSTSKLSIGRTGRVQPEARRGREEVEQVDAAGGAAVQQEPAAARAADRRLATHDTSTAATSASHALPPRASTSAPARAESGCPAAMAPPAPGWRVAVTRPGYNLSGPG